MTKVREVGGSKFISYPSTIIMYLYIFPLKFETVNQPAVTVPLGRQAHAIQGALFTLCFHCTIRLSPQRTRAFSFILDAVCVCQLCVSIAAVCVVLFVLCVCSLCVSVV